jgi:hypothetical protein
MFSKVDVDAADAELQYVTNKAFKGGQRTESWLDSRRSNEAVPAPAAERDSSQIDGEDDDDGLRHFGKQATVRRRNSIQSTTAGRMPNRALIPRKSIKAEGSSVGQPAKARPRGSATEAPFSIGPSSKVESTVPDDASGPGKGGRVNTTGSTLNELSDVDYLAVLGFTYWF